MGHTSYYKKGNEFKVTKMQLDREVYGRQIKSWEMDLKKKGERCGPIHPIKKEITAKLTLRGEWPEKDRNVKIEG